MQLLWTDWLVMIAYFALSLAIGLYYRRRASKGVDEFFVGGRSIPWWLAGTSMVATTFAADTPLAVAGMVALGGVAGNWLWWNFAVGGLLTVFLFARMWRRSGVLTDVEFAELRYSGKPAAFLRGFRAVYLGIPINIVVLGWVNLAMIKILMLALGVSRAEAVVAVLVLIGFTAATSALSGLRGVLVADLVQFGLMMGSSVALAYYAVDAVGGLDQLVAGLASAPGEPLAFFPVSGSAWMPFEALCVYLGLVWWSTWYPGSDPGGGGFVAQRMFSTSDERQSLLATLWFNVAHYGLRTWPWVLVALAATVLYPGLDDPESGYVRVLLEHLPPALRGVMIAGFVAAYMSTVSTNLNWGAGYIVNDVYRRFYRSSADEAELIRVSRWTTLLLAVGSAGITFYMDSISGVWKLLLATGAGTGGVLILRWLWWRVNAWAEVTAMTTAAVVSLGMQLGWGFDTDQPLDFATVMTTTVAVTTVAWLAVMWMTPPEPEQKLREFYRRVRPYGLGWGSIAKLEPEVEPQPGLGRDLVAFGASCLLVYGLMFATGKYLFGDLQAAGIALLIAIVGGAVVVNALKTLERPD